MTCVVGQALEARGQEIWAATKPRRAALGIVDDADLGILVPVSVDVVLAERVEGV